MGTDREPSIYVPWNTLYLYNKGHLMPPKKMGPRFFTTFVPKWKPQLAFKLSLITWYTQNLLLASFGLFTNFRSIMSMWYSHHRRQKIGLKSGTRSLHWRLPKIWPGQYNPEQYKRSDKLITEWSDSAMSSEQDRTNLQAGILSDWWILLQDSC